MPLQVSRFRHGKHSVMASRIVGCDAATKLYVCVRPEGLGSFPEQVRAIYQNLDELLGEQGAQPQHVITERVFFSDLKSQVEPFRNIRREFYGEDGVEESDGDLIVRATRIFPDLSQI